MTILIGLAGPACVGKSTTAKKLVSILRQHDLMACNYAFAEPIYDLGQSITEIPKDILRDQSFKEKQWTEDNAPLPCLTGWSPRKLLQKIGTECFRDQINYNFWVELAIKKVANYDIAIFEDARFENEYKNCDLVIELERDGVKYAMNHPSAMPPDPIYIWKKIKINSSYDFNLLCYNILEELKLRGKNVLQK